VEVRGKEVVLAVTFFVLLMVFTFNFAFRPGSVPNEIMTPGVLWFTFLFAGMLSFQRVVGSEQENGCLDGLMLCPYGRDVIFISKTISSFLFVMVVEAIAIPIFAVIAHNEDQYFAGRMQTADTLDHFAAFLPRAFPDDRYQVFLGTPLPLPDVSAIATWRADLSTAAASYAGHHLRGSSFDPIWQEDPTSVPSSLSRDQSFFDWLCMEHPQACASDWDTPNPDDDPVPTIDETYQFEWPQDDDAEPAIDYPPSQYELPKVHWELDDQVVQDALADSQEDWSDAILGRESLDSDGLPKLQLSDGVP